MADVTVLMTVYNGMPYLREAMDSILGQTYKDFEFLIINDCSTDNSREIILSYADPRIRLIDNDQNLKQTRSLNKGLELAQTELIARMDQDDISHPQRLEKQVTFMQENKDVAVVGNNIRIIDQRGKVVDYVIRPQQDLAIRWYQLFACPLAHPTIMLRKSVIWNKLGGYDPSYILNQDWELWSRITPEYKLANLPDLLLDYRCHINQQQVALHRLAKEESWRINRLNPQRILGIKDESEVWLKNIDLLREHPTFLEQPKEYMEFIGALYKQFCTLFPLAVHDIEVREQLAFQYFLTAERIYARHFFNALEALSLAYKYASKRFFIKHVIRWITIFSGRRIKSWFVKNRV